MIFSAFWEYPGKVLRSFTVGTNRRETGELVFITATGIEPLHAMPRGLVRATRRHSCGAA